MTQKRQLLLVLTAFAACSPMTHADQKAPFSHYFDALLPRLPARVRRLAQELQGGIRYSDMRKLIAADFGQPSRVLGSGVLIEEWNVEGGAVVLNPSAGPSFRFPTGEWWHLIRTINRVSLNIHGAFEVLVAAIPPATGRMYVGTLTFRQDRTYQFSPDGMYRTYGGSLRTLPFGAKHDGRYQLVYAPRVSQDTVLECLPEGYAVAEVVFSGDSQVYDKFRIVNRLNAKHLELISAGPGGFVISRSWENLQ